MNKLSVFRRATSSRLRFGGLGDAADLCASRGGQWDDVNGCVPKGNEAGACLNAGGIWNNGRCEFIGPEVVVQGPPAPGMPVITQLPQIIKLPGAGATPTLPVRPPLGVWPYVAVGAVLLGAFVVWRFT